MATAEVPKSDEVISLMQETATTTQPPKMDTEEKILDTREGGDTPAEMAHDLPVLMRKHLDAFETAYAACHANAADCTAVEEAEKSIKESAEVLKDGIDGAGKPSALVHSYDLFHGDVEKLASMNVQCKANSAKCASLDEVKSVASSAGNHYKEAVSALLHHGGPKEQTSTEDGGPKEQTSTEELQAFDDAADQKETDLLEQRAEARVQGRRRRWHRWHGHWPHRWHVHVDWTCSRSGPACCCDRECKDCGDDHCISRCLYCCARKGIRFIGRGRRLLAANTTEEDTDAESTLESLLIQESSTSTAKAAASGWNSC
jgi:hypothetical protein